VHNRFASKDANRATGGLRAKQQVLENNGPVSIEDSIGVIGNSIGKQMGQK
jgi:hypothetical protein